MDYETAVAWDLLARIITGADAAEADLATTEESQPPRELTRAQGPDSLAR